MSFPIPATTALDMPLPATTPVDRLEAVTPEVTFTSQATDSDMNVPDDTTSLPLQDELETEMTGVDALLAAELESGNTTIENSQASQEIPVFSQEPILEDNTPPSSAISSHNQSQTRAQESVYPLQPQQPQTGENRLRGGQLGLEIPSFDKSSTTAGQKRTADGYLRRSSSSSSSRSSTPQNGDGPDTKRGKTHTRNVSAISTASFAMSPRELTNELKTRLSYAMVKVQKGWESLPLYDLESLASQSGSPSSSSGLTINGNGRRTSAYGSAFTSPRVALARDQSNLSDPGKDAIMRDSVVVPDGQNDNGSQNGYSRTYESFWRSQAQRTLTSPSNAQHAQLAPPADLGSLQRPNGHFRQSPSKTSQPGLQRSGLSQSTSDLSTSSRFSSSSTPQLPHTPAPPPPKDELANRITTALVNNPPTPANSSTPLQQTPVETGRAEQAANKKTQSMQEQDAIETLLFMSSPGNSLLPPPSDRSSQSQSNGPQGSPLKTSFSNSPPQPTHYYPPNDRMYPKLTPREQARRQVEMRRTSGGRLTGEEVERLIDSYRAESSDDEVELEIPSRPPREAPRVAPRVEGIDHTHEARRQEVLRMEQPWQKGGTGSRNTLSRLGEQGREEVGREGKFEVAREGQGEGGSGGGRVPLPAGARSG